MTNKLLHKNVMEHTEKKGQLTYLSWAWAWAEMIKEHPNTTYEIVKNESGMPYFADDSGAVVYTKVTVGDLTHEMWLPVMDHRNKAMKPGEFTMFDINKTIMRCLTKNLAMFGLGLNIYAGEDLPEADPEEIKEKEMIVIIKRNIDKVCKSKGVDTKTWVGNRPCNTVPEANSLLSEAEALISEDDIDIDAGGMTPKDIPA